MNDWPKRRMTDWFCGRCRFKVFGSKTHCKCGNARNGTTTTTILPVGASVFSATVAIPPVGASAVSARAIEEDDWTCPTCKFSIFGSKAECSKCHTKRPPKTESSICAEEDQAKYALDCGHVMCLECAKKSARNNRCPFCRQPIERYFKVYL